MKKDGRMFFCSECNHSIRVPHESKLTGPTKKEGIQTPDYERDGKVDSGFDSDDIPF
jgi:hypothetical protein